MTEIEAFVIIIDVTPNTLYSFATPHKKNEIPSPESTDYPVGAFYFYTDMVYLYSDDPGS